VTKHGIKLGNLVDRQMMIVDAKTGNFVTARKFPKLVLVDVDVTQDERVTLSGPGVDSVTIAMPKQTRGMTKIVTQVTSSLLQSS
jgi:uncharacterized protein YcbX